MWDAHAFADRDVVGFDGSDPAKAAVVWAVAEARSSGRAVTLVHALLPPVTTGGLGVGLPPSLELINEMEHQAAVQLDEVANALDVRDARAVVSIGAPSAVLLEASETAHLVVVGSRGRGGFSGLLLGSVGAQVAAHSQCPVVVVRALPTSAAHVVVVGIDGSPGARAALAFAFDVASRRGWSMIAVHAWDVPAYDLLVVPNGPVPVPLADVADDEIRLAAEALAGFRTDYPDVDVEERLVRSPAVHAILSASPDPALIVVGSHGHGPALGALLGSVSNGVLHKAHVPVVVVPPTPVTKDAA